MSQAYHDQEMNIVKAFEMNIKDALWTTHVPTIIKMMNKRPYVYRKRLDRIFQGEKHISYLFFRTKELKDEYMEVAHETLMNCKPDHQFMGKMFGYPPACVDKFPNRDNEPNNILMNYCGLYFASYPSTIIEDIKWLLENKPHPKGENVQIGNFQVTIGEDIWQDKLIEEAHKQGGVIK